MHRHDPLYDTPPFMELRRKERRRIYAGAGFMLTVGAVMYCIAAGGEPMGELLRIVGGFVLVLGLPYLVARQIDPS